MLEMIKSQITSLVGILIGASFIGALIAGKLCPLTVKVRGKIAAFLWELKVILIIDVIVVIAFIGLTVAGFDVWHLLERLLG